MIYCVVPPELEDELSGTLVEHQRDDPNVEVIVDKRSGPDRRSGEPSGAHRERRELRDRGRRRVPGTFPPIDLPD